jgi:hypothetical protein
MLKYYKFLYFFILNFVLCVLCYVFLFDSVYFHDFG